MINTNSPPSIGYGERKTSAAMVWIGACRPRTLPLSCTPILVASSLAARHTAAVEWSLAIWALLCSLWIQIGTNLINDALDFKKGADTADRLGPQRMTQSGCLSFGQVFWAGCCCFGMAGLTGIPLVGAGGWPLALVLLAAISCGYFYTAGPWPLAYSGISDLFVLIFFGWVSTCTVYYLLTGTVSFPAFLAATQVGCLAMVPHAINNLRDHVADARVHKRTLVVRFGLWTGRWEISVVSMLPFFLSILWWVQGEILAALLPLICLPWMLRIIRAIWQHEPSPRYNGWLAASALCAGAFGGLLALGIWWA